MESGWREEREERPVKIEKEIEEKRLDSRDKTIEMGKKKETKRNKERSERG